MSERVATPAQATVAGGARLAVRPLAPLLAGVFITALNASVLFLVLPPLAREVGLPEYQVGILYGVAALMAALNGPFWGRRSDRWGRKPVFLVGVLGYAVDMGLFALVAWLGLEGRLAPAALFASLFLIRALSGVFGSATQPSAQAYIVDVTPREQRGAGIALLGAAGGMAIVVGPAVGAAAAALSLVAPPLIPAVAGALNALVVWRRLPESRVRVTERPPALSPRDPRVWPFLLATFTIGFSLSQLQATLAFLVQDRLALSATRTTQAAGVAFLAAGLMLVLMQAGVIPRLKPSPVTMLRAGLPVVFVASLLVPAAPTLALLVGAVALSAVGYGLAFPGAQAAPTLLVGPGQQGALGGLTFSALTASYIAGPLLGAVLYGVRPELPYLVAAGLTGALFLFLLAHPVVRRAAVAGHASA
jgi:MFS family permease